MLAQIGGGEEYHRPEEVVHRLACGSEGDWGIEGTFEIKGRVLHAGRAAERRRDTETKRRAAGRISAGVGRCRIEAGDPVCPCPECGSVYQFLSAGVRTDRGTQGVGEAEKGLVTDEELQMMEKSIRENRKEWLGSA